jgi:hypothetical protein
MAPTPLRHLITSFISSDRFSDTFGGCMVQEDGTATVYATEEGSAAMRAALDGREWVIVVAHDGPLPRRAGVGEPSTWPRGGPADLRALLD